MRLLVLLLLTGAVLAQAPSTQAPSNEAPALKSIGTMSEVMVRVIFPTSNEIFYVGRNENKTEKDWEDLRNNALMLAESANLLMADNRAKDKDRWMKDATLLRNVGDKAFKAAKVKDLEGLKALNDELYEACQSCHEHYRPGYRRKL
jgi:cytochrome c556